LEILNIWQYLSFLEISLNQILKISVQEFPISKKSKLGQFVRFANFDDIKNQYQKQDFSRIFVNFVNFAKYPQNGNFIALTFSTIPGF